MGLDFLTSLEEKYGGTIIHQGNLTGRKFVKNDRFRMDWDAMLPFLRRYPSDLEDLSAFVGKYHGVYPQTTHPNA